MDDEQCLNQTKWDCKSCVRQVQQRGFIRRQAFSRRQKWPYSRRRMMWAISDGTPRRQENPGQMPVPELT